MNYDTQSAPQFNINATSSPAPPQPQKKTAQKKKSAKPPKPTSVPKKTKQPAKPKTAPKTKQPPNPPSVPKNSASSNSAQPKSVSQLKQMTKSQLKSINDKEFQRLFNGVLDDMNRQEKEDGRPLTTMNDYNNIVNTIKKIFMDANYMLTGNETNIYDLLTDKTDLILKTISGKSINTQRAIITKIIKILMTDTNQPIKNVRVYELARKKIQLQDKADKMVKNN